MQTNDILWKGIIETLIEDFLAFFYPNEVHLFDFEKGITYLDKELAQLFPEHGDDARKVDKLIQIYLKTGEKKWILIHIEVQGYVDRQFPERLFIYNHRIRERYQKDIGVLAIFTDNNPGFKPDTYTKEFLGTKHVFQYRTYKVLEQNEEELQESKNPFAWVVLATLTALKSGKKNDQNIWQIKNDLVRLLYKQAYPKEKIIALFTFINYYIRFENSENTTNFAQHILSTYEPNSQNMGIYEILIEEAKEKGIDLGIEKGIDLGIEKGIDLGIEKGIDLGIEKGIDLGIGLGIEKEKIEVILTAYKKGVSIELIAEIVQLSVEKVKEIIASSTDTARS